LIDLLSMLLNLAGRFCRRSPVSWRITNLRRMSSATNYDLANIAEAYANMKSSNPYFKHDKHTLTQMVGPVQGIDLIDLGCGDGYYARHFKQLGARRVIGVDLSKDMVAIAQAKESKTPMGIQYICADCKDLPKLEIGTFRTAIASYLLNYIPTLTEMSELLKGIANFLPPGGRFVGITVNPMLGLDDQPAWYLKKYGGFVYERKFAKSGGMVKALINPMDDSADPIAIDVYIYDAEAYENAFKKAGFGKLEWVSPMESPDAAGFEKKFFDEHIAGFYIGTMPR